MRGCPKPPECTLKIFRCQVQVPPCLPAALVLQLVGCAEGRGGGIPVPGDLPTWGKEKQAGRRAPQPGSIYCHC